MNRHSAHRHVARAAWWVLALCVAGVPQAHAARKARPDPRALERDADKLPDDFRLLATQKPWQCAEPGPRAPDAGWGDGGAQCAWQNRLRLRTWHWKDAGTAGCVSRQARWWAWMHGGLPPAAPRQPWQAGWSGRSDRFALDGEQRLVLVERDRDGAWTAREWRWNPSPRAATRRWQEGRWKLLADAARRRHAGAADANANLNANANANAIAAGRLHAVFGAVLGPRPGEIGPAGMRMETDGVCLTLAEPLPGQPRLPLSYRPDDSRLEQRAAMHLLLSRQYPRATWLAPFHLVAMPQEVAGGAKFMAAWIEGDQLKAQLWMPSKDGAPTVRVRMTAPVPAGAPANQPVPSAPLTRTQQIVERELREVAVRWARSYE